MPQESIDGVLAIPVPVSDLQIIRAALNSGYHHCTVLDLADQYRKLTARPQASNLTKSLQNALTLVGAYIQLAETDVEEEPNE